MGKRPIALNYSYRHHDKVTRWLFEHASINSVEDIDYNDDGTITLRVPIDDITHQKYLKEFENERFEGNKRQTGRIAPPPGWNAKG